MKIKRKSLWITYTATFIALLIVLQLATAPLANPLITGSIVNFLLIVCVMTCGLSSGIVVAIISPVMAKLVGIGPLWSIIPFIAAGNTILIIVWNFIGNIKIRHKIVAYIIALVVAAAAKFAVLYFGIVKIAVPFLLNLPEAQAKAISGMFSYPQLITASIGGAVAAAILPVILKAIGKRRVKTEN